MLSFYIDPKIVDPANFLPGELARFVGYVKSAKPIPGEEILVPGDQENRTRAKREAEGVPLPDDIWQSMLGTARQVGLDEARIAQATV
jgi:uncharacterized oxidoreductase